MNYFLSIVLAYIFCIFLNIKLKKIIALFAFFYTFCLKVIILRTYQCQCSLYLRFL